jgi:copper(I)-binding protein
MRLANLLAAAAVVIAMPGMAVAAHKAASSLVAALGVRDAVIHPGPQGGTTAAYMTLVNPGGRAIKLEAVECGCAEMTMAHRSSEQGGMAHMAPAGEVIVPPHGQLAFAPGGLHLMVMGLKRGLRLGEHVPIRITPQGSPALTVDFVVSR